MVIILQLRGTNHVVSPIKIIIPPTGSMVKDGGVHDVQNNHHQTDYKKYLHTFPKSYENIPISLALYKMYKYKVHLNIINLFKKKIHDHHIVVSM